MVRAGCRECPANDATAGEPVIVDQVAAEMTLESDELLVLRLLQQVMIGRDLIAEKGQGRTGHDSSSREGFRRVSDRFDLSGA